MFCALEQRQNNIVTVHWSYDTLALCAYGWKALGASLGVLLTNEKNLMLLNRSSKSRSPVCMWLDKLQPAIPLKLPTSVCI